MKQHSHRHRCPPTHSSLVSSRVCLASGQREMPGPPANSLQYRQEQITSLPTHSTKLLRRCTTYQTFKGALALMFYPARHTKLVQPRTQSYLPLSLSSLHLASLFVSQFQPTFVLTQPHQANCVVCLCSNKLITVSLFLRLWSMTHPFSLHTHNRTRPRPDTTLPLTVLLLPPGHRQGHHPAPPSTPQIPSPCYLRPERFAAAGRLLTSTSVGECSMMVFFAVWGLYTE